MKFISRYTACLRVLSQIFHTCAYWIRRTLFIMADRLSDPQMLKLVEIYQDYDCLWNVTSKLYRNRDARESAYKQIAERLNITGISNKEIPKKIKSLRSSYYQELKRIEASTRSGASQDSVYKPKVSWFTIADGFLRTFRNNQETVSNIDENSNVNSNNDSESQNSESLEETQHFESLEDNTTEENSNDAVINNNESNRIEREQIENSAPQFVVPAKKTVRKRGKLLRKDDDIHEAIDRIDKIAKSVTNSTNSLIENKEDEFDIFGKYLATTLRSLPSELAIIAKTDIQKALSDIQLRALRQQNHSQLLSYGASTSSYDPQNPGYFSSTSESGLSYNVDTNVDFNSM